MIQRDVQASVAQAGPPMPTDDPQPVDYGHYEIYLFARIKRFCFVHFNAAISTIRLNAKTLVGELAFQNKTTPSRLFSRVVGLTCQGASKGGSTERVSFPVAIITGITLESDTVNGDTY